MAWRGQAVLKFFYLVTLLKCFLQPYAVCKPRQVECAEEKDFASPSLFQLK